MQDTIPVCPTQLSQHLALGAVGAGRAWVAERVDGLAPNRAAVLAALEPLGGLGRGVAGGEGAIYFWAALPPGAACLHAVAWLCACLPAGARVWARLHVGGWVWACLHAGARAGSRRQGDPRVGCTLCGWRRRGGGHCGCGRMAAWLPCLWAINQGHHLAKWTLVAPLPAPPPLGPLN